jgi:nitrogen-specific signal transduction histidine kinase/CheY-like chemotaxis protein
MEFHAAYVRDITERQRAREEQVKLEHHLQQAQKLEAIGTLAGGIAHDFNNMLGVILGYAELLKRRLSHDPENVRDLGEIEQAALRSRDITRQLLAFSRKQTIVPVSLNLNEQIATTLKMLGRLIGVHIALDFRGEKDLWNNRLDPSQLDQILINLAVNARDAMPDGGKLTITTANVVIDENYAAARSDATPGQFVRLTVQDTGVGMDADTLSRVFEPFFTTKEVGKGTGLGLATIYGIIKQNSGFAEISSVPGQGSAFHIYFPRDTRRDELIESVHMTPDDVASARILLVEDHDMVRGMTARMLESLGHRVVSMSGPLAALNWCESQKGVVDLLLTDIMMPEMGGVELSQMIKNLNPDIRVLMMSGYAPALGGQDGAVPEGMNFIQKPFSKSDLARKVDDILKS